MYWRDNSNLKNTLYQGCLSTFLSGGGRGKSGKPLQGCGSGVRSKTPKKFYNNAFRL